MGFDVVLGMGRYIIQRRGLVEKGVSISRMGCENVIEDFSLPRERLLKALRY
jgi:hypothetical protein